MKTIFFLALANYNLCKGAIYPISVEISNTLAYIYSEARHAGKGKGGLVVAVDSITLRLWFKLNRVQCIQETTVLLEIAKVSSP